MARVELKRSIGFGLLTLYGVGTMTGAGIYVLVGKVAGYAGWHAPLAFVLSAVVAGFTAFSYAGLSSLIPESAGEVAYIKKGLKLKSVARIVGWLVILSGIVSSASLVTGFSGYLRELVIWKDVWVETAVVLLIGGVVIWGVRTSVIAASVITILEIAGLIIIIYLGLPYLWELPDHLPRMLTFESSSAFSGLMLGAFLAFFAFIGFEDLANMAEETINPEQTVPRGIITSLVIVTILYILVSTVTLLVMPLETLANSDAPLADFMAQQYAPLENLIVVISLVAVINGVLIQMIMCSRVLYGLGKQGLAPEIFAQVSQFTRTPIWASLFVIVLVFVFTLTLPIVTLANTTSYIILTVFILVNASLIALKRRGEAGAAKVKIPVFVPWAGAILSGLFLLGKTITELT